MADRLRRTGAVLRKGRAVVPRPRAEGSRSDRASGQRTVSVRTGFQRAAHPASLRRPDGSRLPSIPGSLRRHDGRAEHGVQHLHPLSDLRRLSVPRARQVRRRNCGRATRPRVSQCDAAPQREGRQIRDEHRGEAVTEVVAEVGGERETFRGEIVVVSCGAANTAKLLLMSANDKHPNGLANGSDQVGRNYMFHNSQAVLALSREPNPTKYQKTLGLKDVYVGTDDFPHPMGNIQMVGKSQGPMYRGEKPIETALLPMWSLDDIARHAVDFWLSTEDLPDPNNRVSVDSQGNITLTYTPNNQVPKQKLY